MLDEMKTYHQQDLSETEIAECCYRISVNYWHKVKECFQQRVMVPDEEEIGFFKNVKPLFTAHIEYNLVLFQGLLFMPPEENETFRYWQKESNRYQRFFDRNADFIRYYESNCGDNDANYFLQRNNHIGLLPQERIYEDMDCRSSHDHLVRRLLANRMYRQYVQERLSQLASNE